MLYGQSSLLHIPGQESAYNPAKFHQISPNKNDSLIRPQNLKRKFDNVAKEK